jgi:dodecin
MSRPSERPEAMVYKKITLIGSSTESFEAAVDNAIESADQTLDQIHWVDVVSQGVEVASVEQPEYQAEVELAFQLDQ